MLHLAWTNLRYRLLRTIVAVLSIAVGIWLAMILRGVSQGTLAHSLEEMRRLDRFLMLRAPGPIFRLNQSLFEYDPKLVTELRTVPGIDAVIPFRYFLQQLTPEQIGMVAALPLESAQAASELFPLLSGRVMAAPGEGTMETDLAGMVGVKLGQSITLTGLGSIKIVGIFRARAAIGAIQVIADYESISQTLNDTRIQGVFIRVGNSKMVEPVRHEVGTRFPKMLIEPLQVMADSLGGVLERFEQFIGLMFWMSITVSALISGLVLLSMVGEQRRDLGILKAMGASDGAVLSLVVSQALLLGLAGSVLGASMAYVMQIEVLPRFFPGLHMELTLQWVLEALGSGLAAGLMGALGSTVYALRVDPVEVLTYE